jgi:hypothetical protein
MRLRLVALFALFALAAPAIGATAPLTDADVSFTNFWSGSPLGPSLDRADTNGSSGPNFDNGPRIDFDEPFTGAWTFELRTIEGPWPIRINCDPCFQGPTFFLPLTVVGMPRELVPFQTITLQLTGVQFLNFGIGGAGTSTLEMQNLVFTPAANAFTPAADAVPEPATGVLVITGAMIVAARMYVGRRTSLSR